MHSCEKERLKSACLMSRHSIIVDLFFFFFFNAHCNVMCSHSIVIKTQKMIISLILMN